ncbi:TBC1 domain family member 7 [Episyrphus balteatus]|uniref:TBC1 domain family member 7 n=1 Tax=Episyrphus balteatus TaxID=286459 RepID=UPI0024866412|nr:TBC1 domain family member 7 [Episyrphus balteatus]
MTTDERNFRSSYYEKVGCNSVEEKKSLNILLKDHTLTRLKLQQFCLSFTVPTNQRTLVWNIILGILPLPVHQNATSYVMEQRTAVYTDVLRAVTIMRYIDENTPKCKVLYAMWLLENKKLHPDTNINEDNHFVEIAKVLLRMFENDVDVYWIAKEFYELTKVIKAELPKLKELTQTILKREDNLLYNHLDSHQFFKSQIIEEWYGTCFAGIINEVALVKVWDKICGGSKKILIFILLELLKTETFRSALLQCKTVDTMKKSIEKARDQDVSSVLNKAVKSWKSCNTIHNEINIH